MTYKFTFKLTQGKTFKFTQGKTKNLRIALKSNMLHINQLYL